MNSEQEKGQGNRFGCWEVCCIRTWQVDPTFILVEYRAEDPKVAIKRLHKMSEAQAIKEMESLGLDWLETRTSLPQQHLILAKPH